MTGEAAVERGARREVRSTGVRVVCTDDGHRLDGESPITVIANLFLGHLGSRAFSSSTVRAYAFDLLNFARFLAENNLLMHPDGVAVSLDDCKELAPAEGAA